MRCIQAQLKKWKNVYIATLLCHNSTFFVENINDWIVGASKKLLLSVASLRAIDWPI